MKIDAKDNVHPCSLLSLLLSNKDKIIFIEIICAERSPLFRFAEKQSTFVSGKVTRERDSEFAWVPSSGVLGGNDVNPGTSKVNINGADFEEGSGDLEEDGIPNLNTNMSRMVGGVNMSSNSNKSSGKRKERDPSKGQCRKKKTSGIGVQMLSMWDQLLESMSTKSDSTSLNMDREGCSILEVMVELHSIPGVSVDNDFHDFAMDNLGIKRKQEMWYNRGTLEQKFKWL